MDAQDQLKRGTLWLGTASVVARVVDVGATLAVVGLLSKAQMGLASLALSVCAILESLSGVGVGGALVQVENLSRKEESTLFWLTSAIGLGLGALAAALAPVLAHVYSEPDLLPLVAASGLKLIFIGMGIVPLQLLNRRLGFKEVGTVQTLASLGEGATKLVLALAGAGAWALVVGNVMRGGVLLLALWWLAAFRPQLHFAFAEARRFVRFGLHLAGSSILHQLYKSADYFLIGKLLGLEALGVYRVAFDLAMQASDAIVTVVARVSFPVYSRLSGDLPALVSSFLSSTRSLFLMLVPVAVFIFFGADDVLQLLGSGRWAGAAPAAQILVWAGLLRAASLLFPPVYVAIGRPQYATLDSAVTLVVLTGCFWFGLRAFPELGVLSVCFSWLGVYPLLLCWHLLLFRRFVGLEPLRYLSAIATGLAPAPVIALGLFLVSRLAAWAGLGEVALVPLALTVIIIHWCYLRWVLKVRWRELLPKRAARSMPLAGSE